MAGAMDLILMHDQIGRMAQALDGLASRMERLTGAATDGTARVREGWRGVGADMERAARQGEVAFERSTGRMTQLWSRFRAQVRMPGEAGGFQLGTGGRIPFTNRHWEGHLPGYGLMGGQTGMWRGAQNAVSQVPLIGHGLSQAMGPFGLIAALIAAQSQSQKRTAEGWAAARQLAQSGGVSSAFGGGLGRRMWDVETKLGRDPGFAESLGAAGAAGFGENDVMAKMANTVRGLNDNALETAIGLDLMFKQASGTTAREAAKLASETNMTFSESVSVVRDLGLSARGTGISFGAMVGAVSQSVSAMRLFNMSSKDVKGLGDAVQGVARGFMREGFSPQAASKLGAEGVGGLAQLVAGGLKPGMAAIIGHRISQSQGLGYNELESQLMMQKGFRNTPGAEGFFGKAIGEMQKILGEAAPGASKLEQERIAQMLFGMTPLVADAFMKFQQKGKGATAEDEEDLRKAFEQAQMETPEYLRKINEVLQGMSKMLSGGLAIIVAGLTSLVQLAKYGLAWMTGDEVGKTAAAGRINALGKVIDNGFSTFISGAGQIGSGAAGYMSSILAPQVDEAATSSNASVGDADFNWGERDEEKHRAAMREGRAGARQLTKKGRTFVPVLGELHTGATLDRNVGMARGYAAVDMEENLRLHWRVEKLGPSVKGGTSASTATKE